MKLIDKDAVVAEIEERLDKLYNILPDASKVENGNITIPESCNTGKYMALESFRKFIDTLEVKEVDFENYIHGTIDYPIIGSDFPNIYPNYKELKNYCDKNRIMDNDKVRLIMIKEDMP